MKILTIFFSAWLLLVNQSLAIENIAGADLTKYGEPSSTHKNLKKLSGNWNYTLTLWENDKAKPQKSQGSSVNKMILNGRFLQQSAKGKIAGDDYEGLGLLGYDNFKEEYQLIWTDSMSTGMLWSTGNLDTKSRVIKQVGSFADPLTQNKFQRFRTEIEIINDKEYRFSMYVKTASSDEFKTMEIIFKRPS